MSEDKEDFYEKLIELIEDKYKEVIMTGRIPYYLFMSKDFFKVYKEHHKELSDDVLYFYNKMEIIVYHDKEKFIDITGLSAR
jgi:hypothetical protein